MKTNIRIPIIITIAVIILCCFGYVLKRNDPTDPGFLGTAEFYYETNDDNADVDWTEYIPVFHYWVDIEPDHYLFETPTAEQVVTWKTLCESRNPVDSAMRRSVQGYYLNMNHYMTVNDFVELWYHEDSYVDNDSLTLWRLAQYDFGYSQNIYSNDSEYDRFSQLRNIIQSLCTYEAGSQWELNFQSGLESDLQKFYARMLVKEAVRHADVLLKEALLLEEEAWSDYHSALDSAFRVIDGDEHGMIGSAWPMAVAGIARDDAETRAISLEDFYFALTDSLDYGPAGSHRKSMIGEYEIQRYTQVSEDAVIKEYGNFMGFLSDKDFFDPEFSYPLSVRQRALSLELNTWKEWMSARKRVSSLLSGLCKDIYDNSTNNVRRRKLIMLKNRYQGFGLTSGDIMKCTLPYSCDDSEIAGFTFERNWNSL